MKSLIRIQIVAALLATPRLSAQIASMGGTSPLPEGPTPKLLSDLRWSAAGGGLEMAMLDGDPTVDGQPFTMLLRLADGAWIPPHTHNIAKRLLVVSGTLLLGHGERLDSSSVTQMPAGSFVVMPPDHAHYEGGRGVTIVALYGIGPLRTTVVRPPTR
ncbi:MAG: cupin domain-containing protein [Gemmatimonadota bacterium]